MIDIASCGRRSATAVWISFCISWLLFGSNKVDGRINMVRNYEPKLSLDTSLLSQNMDIVRHPPWSINWTIINVGT